MRKNIGIIGAGVGGAGYGGTIELPGYPVTVYEKLPRCGGRANIIENSGFRIER